MFSIKMFDEEEMMERFDEVYTDDEDKDNKNT